MRDDEQEEGREVEGQALGAEEAAVTEEQSEAPAAKDDRDDDVEGHRTRLSDERRKRAIALIGR